jgi:tRNA (cytidine/uridine-2'-O-)-methyltransferase
LGITVRIVLFQPDIPQNVGAAIRLAACFGVALDIIEPCAFPMSDKTLKRASLDYGRLAEVVRHNSWEIFLESDIAKAGRLVLVETNGAQFIHEFEFTAKDLLVLGRESAGVTEAVVSACAASVAIPIMQEARSLNVHTATAIALAEGLRQTGALAAMAASR